MLTGVANRHFFPYDPQPRCHPEGQRGISPLLFVIQSPIFYTKQNL